MQSEKFAKVTTIVDNNVFKKGLASSWGLSFYVETCTNDKKHSVLMDTSGSFQAFIGNASELGLNLSEVEAILISHWHSDHCGALSQVLTLIRRSTPVYAPSASTSGIREIINANREPVVCSKPIEFMDGLMSTGEIPNGISEHSLLVNVKNRGLVVLVGCSHPGIINVLKHAQKVSDVDKIYAVIGGFHIRSVGEGIRIGEFLRELDVKLVSPCHCTSNDAMQGIAKIMGERCIRNGSGKIISIG
jgi:7,8-dihydropterin-6-yl-methyl-4-(beta-D-ribofuranosyl)aminobenzene 5'-phosphate synthase